MSPELTNTSFIINAGAPWRWARRLQRALRAQLGPGHPTQAASCVRMTSRYVNGVVALAPLIVSVPICTARPSRRHATCNVAVASTPHLRLQLGVFVLCLAQNVRRQNDSLCCRPLLLFCEQVT